MVAVEVERMLRLAEQCLERAKSFIGKRAAPPDPSTFVTVSSASSPVQSEPLQSNVLPLASTGKTKPYSLVKAAFCFFNCVALSL